MKIANESGKNLGTIHFVNRGTLLAAMLAVGVMTTGCQLLLLGAAAGAGAAGAAYVRGDLKTNVEATPADVEKASVKAFDSLDIRTIWSAGSALDAQVIGRTAADEKVTVTAKAGESGGSSLSIRIGAFGDETMSRKILDEIKMHLP